MTNKLLIIRVAISQIEQLWKENKCTKEFYEESIDYLSKKLQK